MKKRLVFLGLLPALFISCQCQTPPTFETWREAAASACAEADASKTVQTTGDGAMRGTRNQTIYCGTIVGIDTEVETKSSFLSRRVKIKGEKHLLLMADGVVIQMGRLPDVFRTGVPVAIWPKHGAVIAIDE